MRRLPIPENVSELKGDIATMLLWAPDGFHEMRQYSGLEPYSLDRGFELMRQAVARIFGLNHPLHDRILQIFDHAQWLYLYGDAQEAADKLMEADNLL